MIPMDGHDEEPQSGEHSDWDDTILDESPVRPVGPTRGNEPADKTKFKFGIIYLSYIPDGLNVKLLRDIMSEFGEVGRIYLEPQTSNRKKYIEGWIEFKKKRVAKSVAQTLNGATLNYGRKNSRINGQVWSIKYLHRFKWCHLTEQLAHDKAVKDQKRRFEMSQTKKQVDFYQRITERSRLMKRKKKHKDEEEEGGLDGESARIQALKTKQNKPVGQGKELAVPVDDDLLSSIFKKV